MSSETFLGIEQSAKYLPGADDVEIVRRPLCCKGLPLELTLDIMEEAGYEAVRRIPHDPFHLRNREELGRYLKYCWQTLVRCDMLAKAIGVKIWWKNLIKDCLVAFFGEEDSNSRKWYEWDLDPEWPELHRVFI